MVWKLKPEDRLRRWKDLRYKINSMPIDQALIELVDFWHKCPFTPYYLDPAKPHTWPDPWTLLTENYYCDLAKSLGILYTIALTEHAMNLELRIYQGPQGIYNLVWVDDGKYVLNMTDTEIVNNTQVEQLSLGLKFKYNSKQLKLDNY